MSESTKPFFLVPDNPSTVKVLEVWSGWGGGEKKTWVVKGFQLTWFNGEHGRVYKNPDDSDGYDSFEFQSDEKITECNLRSAWRLDKIEFNTSTGRHFAAGGDGGTLVPRIGQGFLVGLEGQAGWEIDSLDVVKFK
ncbi:hypothetical protein BDV23DRAFT_54418 [Aspergillus alliaceus]|uniref:Jacalin-type lectin domain-containing protein n=1 Tax=Petromyces alliaceus TaxID=209559 RepID=A0A5N7CF96_PETAA|nr:hypothetical protein BDV23DRAFT_54418 [Aspergillus alliaceus]